MSILTFLMALGVIAQITLTVAWAFVHWDELEPMEVVALAFLSAVMLGLMGALL